MISGKVFVFFVVLGVALAYNPGQYVPKSFYVIDHYGHQSAPVFIRNRRDIMNHPIFRVRRGDNYASSSSQASASASSSSSSGGGGGPVYYGGDYSPNVASDPSGILGHVQNLLNNLPTGGSSGGGGAQSFASASSSSNAGTGGYGSGGSGGSGQSYGGLGSGQDAGYHGPVLFSRFGETEGSGVNVEGHAQGEKGAFSSSSAGIDDKGKIKYSVQSGKY